MKTVGRIFVAYLLLVLLFTGALTLAFLIPQRAIKDNVRLSVHQVADEGARFNTRVGLVEPYKLGSFSDCLILGIAYCADSNRPLSSAMNATFPAKDGSPVTGARLMLDNPQDESLQPVIYSRYWHGNQVVIRPLLCFMTVKGIRWLNIVLLGGLLVLFAVVMWCRINHVDALIITLCLGAVMIPSVPLCLNYVPPFYIALIASLLILLWPRATSRWENTVTLFFVIGAMTTFFDLLTTPMIAMAIPVMVYVLDHKPKHPCRTVVLLALAWLAGYASLWATKWLLAMAITGHAALQDAMGAVTQRTVGHNEQGYMLWCLKMTSIALVAVSAIVTAIVVTFRKSRQALRDNRWMLLIAASSFVWVFVLLEHTWHHLHFTWRTFIVLAIGVLLYLHHSITLHLPKNYETDCSDHSVL